MDDLDVTPSRLHTLADTLDTAARAIEAELETLAGAADTLRLEWEGDAQEAFDLAQTRFRAEAEARCTALTGIAVVARALADGYGEVDRRASSTLGGQ